MIWRPKLDIDVDEAMAVGDGANDLGMLTLAGAGVALHAKPIVAQQAKIRIDHADLSALLYIQATPEKSLNTRHDHCQNTKTDHSKLAR